MWLRSERRDRRLRRSHNRPTTTITTNLINLIKKSPRSPRNVKVYNNNNNNNNNSACNKKSAGISKISKCNITPKNPVVKRLNGIRTSGRKCKRRRNIEKENIWKDSNEVTLYEQTPETEENGGGSRRKKNNNKTDITIVKDSSLGSSNDDLNTFGPISFSHSSLQKQQQQEQSQTTTITSKNCTVSTSTNIIPFNEPVSTSEENYSLTNDEDNNCQRNISQAQLDANLTKCVRECHSTTDYVTNRSCFPAATSQHHTYYSVSIFNREQTNSSESLDSEVDSTTDIYSGQGNSPPNSITNNMLTTISEKETIENISPTLTYNSCNFTNSCADFKGLSCSILPSGSYPTTPDLISMFDEDISKSTSAAATAATSSSINHTTASNHDLCQYSDFLPYNTILTQAFLNCTEANQLCDAQDLVNVTTANTSSYLHQTAIDNLKALTNLPTHTTNLFSTLNLPKASNEVVDSLIQSVPSYGGQDHNINGIYCKSSTDGDMQIDPDDCPEIEEMPDTRQEEMQWDVFDPYVFIKHLPPLTVEMRAKCPALPLKTHSSPEFSLVLDLDETLVHCSLQELSDASFKFPVLFQVYINYYIK